MTPHTLSITFTYDHLKGTFTGVLPNGTTFEFVAAMEATLPIKMRMELVTLAHQTIDLAKQRHQALAKTINSPTLTPEEFEAKLADYLAKGGLVQKATHVGGRRPPRKATVRPSLDDLGLDTIDLENLDI